MEGKVVVITGGTSGIGQAGALKLAGMGARIVLVARDRARGEATLTRLGEANSRAEHAVHYADLSLMSETRRVAADIAQGEQGIDVLINNAGALFGRREVTTEGLEKTFALNHMSYFVLTEGLRARLADDGRVVSTASDAHRGARFRIDRLQSERYRSFGAYSLSKLCNILFTRELARTFAGTGITANCQHPGVVASRFFDGKPGLMGMAIKLVKPFAISNERGAETLVYLASSDEVSGVTGQYFSKCRPAIPTTEGRNDESARELWKKSVRLYESA